MISPEEDERTSQIQKLNDQEKMHNDSGKFYRLLNHVLHAEPDSFLVTRVYKVNKLCSYQQLSLK